MVNQNAAAVTPRTRTGQQSGKGEEQVARPGAPPVMSSPSPAPPATASPPCVPSRGSAQLRCCPPHAVRRRAQEININGEGERQKEKPPEEGACTKTEARETQMQRCTRKPVRQRHGSCESCVHALVLFVQVRAETRVRARRATVTERHRSALALALTPSLPHTRTQRDALPRNHTPSNVNTGRRRRHGTSSIGGTRKADTQKIQAAARWEEAG